MSNQRKHITEIHYLRALACLMVVLVHVSAAFYNNQGKVWNDFTFFINQISRFGTPIFALISGFLLFYQVRNKGFKFNKFITSRFTKIVIPFFFWSVFYLVFMYLMEGQNPLQAGEKLFLVNFIFGNSFYHLYFMSIVFQFYLVFPIFQLARSRKSWVVLLGLAIIVNLYFLTSYTTGQFESLWRTILNQRAFLPSWIFYFTFGGFLAYFWEPIARLSKKYVHVFSVLVVIIIALAVYEYKIVGSIPSNRATNMLNIPLLTLFVIGITEQIVKFKWLKGFLTSIGTLSMSIYLVHPFVLYSFQQIAPDFFWNTVLFPVVFLIILGGSILTVRVTQLLPFNQYILTIPKARTQVKQINQSTQHKQRSITQ
ncbi:acyltransferase [Peribacillus cavernae]|uniref:Acyltransferase n=1 Tax=Peribacillus cavernae TaxID=1674310 RepID=A0A433HSZ5_9BACI|nr:acyltransferase [Peribacillus cavernae]MDQ0218452.1 peptidoglycan/LPS O-acetylase OafA/YrhL [Peribacillus cavernae]RUQ31451.1 acyltransferase [Peribacillus cavernae]